MTTIERPTGLTVEEILDTYVTNKWRGGGYTDGAPWHAHHDLEFKVGPARAMVHSPHDAFSGVWSVKVKEPKRGRGHGRRLMETIVAFADADGRGLHLEVAASNEVAIHLYESVGFRIEWTRTARDAERCGIANKAVTHGMKRYPTHVPDTPEWTRHFEAKALRLEQDHEPTPEGTEDMIPMLDAIYAAQMGESGADERDRYSGSENYRDNTRRLHGVAFREALLASGWTIARVGETQ